MIRRIAMLAVLAMLAAGEARGADLSIPGDAGSGAKLFKQRCSACHGLSENRFGPSLGDVHGRRAAGATGFRYSKGLQAQSFTWTDAALDAWLADPKRFVPGAAMPARVGDARDRADLIAYLRTTPAGR